MPLSARREERGRDLRLPLLIMVALAIVAYPLLGSVLAGIWQPWRSDRQVSRLSWTTYEWSWGKETLPEVRFDGPSRSKKATDTIDAPRSKDDPRLAIFTYRRMELNRVDAASLQTIKGIGPKLAGAIVSYRLSHGPFHRLDDLLLIKGIGPAKLSNLRSRLQVSDEEPGK